MKPNKVFQLKDNRRLSIDVWTTSEKVCIGRVGGGGCPQSEKVWTGMADTSENITFPQLRWRAVITLKQYCTYYIIISTHLIIFKNTFYEMDI